jgi:molecular chaperone DnaK
MAKILGIDLGTTNSAVAIMEGGEPRIIENAEGARTTPSVVAIAKNGERLVGTLAKRQAVTNPKNTIYGIKRFMGHSFSDDAVKNNSTMLPYEIKAGPDGGVLVHLGDKDYRPEEVSSMILSKLKADAEAKLGEKITQAVITVPAYFDDAQRNATKAAGEVAGLEVLRIINEPTAAALAYGFNKKKEEKIVVYDFGGGTFDVSVLEVGDDVIEVKSTDGDSHMGGRDIDQKIVRYIADEYKKESGIDVTKDPLALQRLDEAAEKAKHELSTSAETEINIPFITSTDQGPQHLLLKITRATLESLSEEFITRSVDIVKRALEAASLKPSEINEIIMVGGQTRMPKIQEEVKALFGKELHMGVNPDEVVAIGAAIQAGILQGDVKDILLVDVIPLSLSIETMGGVATKLIERNTAVPTSRSQTFSTAADNQTSVEIHVVQGERSMAVDNKSLGKFMLDGIPPAPRGMPQVEVSFDLDTNGILTVKALEKTTGKVQSIRIEGSTGLSQADIDRMKADAETNADSDKKRKEMVEAKNLAEQMIFTAEKAIKDAGDKAPAEVVTEVNEKVAVLKTAKEGEDMDAIKKASEDLSTSLSKVGEAMMKAHESEAGDKAANPVKDSSDPSASAGPDAAAGENSEQEPTVPNDAPVDVDATEKPK